VPASLRKNMELWIGCVAGALSDQDYLAKLASAGFEAAEIEVTRVYTVEDAKEFLAGQCADLQQVASEVDGKFVSAFVRAVKPVAQPSVAAGTEAAPRSSAASACCAPKCC
jgi:arsenite methyltransferase